MSPKCRERGPLDQEITLQELLKGSGILKSGKGVGVDNLSTEMLACLVEVHPGLPDVLTECTLQIYSLTVITSFIYSLYLLVVLLYLLYCTVLLTVFTNCSYSQYFVTMTE